MAVSLRMTRKGSKNRPYYWIVAADGRNSRDGRYLEKLGTYNPMLAKDDANRVTLNTERCQYWISNGAQPSERVSFFLGKAGLIADPKRRQSVEKAKPKAAAVERVREREEKANARKEAEAQAKADAEAAKNAPVEEAAPAAETTEEAQA